MTSPRVLLVNDSPDERDMYTESLQRFGFCTVHASTAVEAYRIAAELPPAAIVTELRLPGEEDGLLLTRRLKGDTRMRQVPVVVLTGDVFPRDREAAARAGCDLFLPKPCLPDVLSTHVTSLIRVHA